MDALLDSCPGSGCLRPAARPCASQARLSGWSHPFRARLWAGPDRPGRARRLRVGAAVSRAGDRPRDPSFLLTSRNGTAVEQVSAGIGGGPDLAIELAAARMGVLSVEQIAEKLDDPLRLLTTSGRTALPRQQTLRASAGVELRAPRRAQRMLFERLSVFAGGWTLEAVEAVGASDGIEEHDVLDLLSWLVDKSLVMAEVAGGGRGLVVPDAGDGPPVRAGATGGERRGADVRRRHAKNTTW